MRGYAHRNKLSIETAARELRIESLLDIAKAKHCKWIAAAHHKDDNAETADALIDPDRTTYFSIVDVGISGGSSLSLGSTSLHEYAVYGLYKSTDGESLVEVGYRKRF